MNYTDSVKKVLEIAKSEGEALGHGQIGTEHILLGLIIERDGLASRVLKSNNIDEVTVRKMIEENIDTNSDILVADPDGYSPSAKRIVEHAKREAENVNATSIGTEHFLMAILKDKDCLAIRILNTIKGVNLRKMYLDIVSVIGVNDKNSNIKTFNPMSNTPVLDNFSRDLTQMSKNDLIDPVIGRSNEISRVIQILSRRTKNNPCLIGEPGVGKTAIAEGLANLIVKGDVPEIVKNKRVVNLDVGGMVAGTKYRGEFEERIKRIIEEVKNNKEIILFIDEIHSLIGAGDATGSLDAANILKPALARGDLQVIGATTIDEYRKYIEKDAALERRFQTVQVNEPSIEDSIKILNGLKYRYEKYHNVKINEDAVEAAVKLSARYIQDRNLPDKAIDLIDEACAKTKIAYFTNPTLYKEYEEKLRDLDAKKEEYIIKDDFESAKKINQEKEALMKHFDDIKNKNNANENEINLSIGEEDIADVVSTWTSIPVKKITEDENKKLANLENDLHKRVIGQNDAVTSISKAIRRNRIGLKDPKKPIGTFLFLGPTGVGKTELCKALADIMFGSEENLIRVDMSEYMERHTVSKLIGSPPGYVGYDEGGQLTEKIRRKPYSVVLFDEIEKAHQDVFNIMLQIFDDGHITDSQGRKVDFKNCIIIMTSNVGANLIVNPKNLGFKLSDSDEKKEYEDMKSNIMSEIKNVFKPEFINRIDEIIVFHKLDKEDIKNILDLQLKQIIDRAKESLNVDIVVDEDAKELILKEGFEQQYGARKLKRTLTELLENLIADETVNGNIKMNDKITITANEDKLVIKKNNKNSKKDVKNAKEE